MATITEAALRGQWFYLEANQPVVQKSRVYIELLNGYIRSEARFDLVGTYFIGGAKAILTFSRDRQPDFVITLHATGDLFDETTTVLKADGRYRTEVFGQPVNYSGTFVRRAADRSSSVPVWRRIA